MKTFKKTKIIFICALGLLIANACTKNFQDLNTDPRIVTTGVIDLKLVLTYVEESAVQGDASYGNGSYGSFCGMCKRDDDRPFEIGDAPDQWNFEYQTVLNNLSNIIQMTQDNPDLANKTAIARILKAWSVTKLTDTYGDVPYSESCLPKEKAVYTPKYDSQQSIYTDLIKELKEAAAQLDASKDSYGAADLVYSGDVTKWKKLANSLRLRAALRVRYADANLATTSLSDLTEADLITTLADDAFVKNNTDYPSHLNPRFYRIINYGTIEESVWACKTMIDILKNDGVNFDPRIQIYADTASGAVMGTINQYGDTVPYFGYRGSPILGLVDQTYKYPWGSGTVSRLCDFWRVPVVAPAIIKCSEVYFALAEAKLFNLLPAGFTGTPQDYYQKGIDAGIEWAQWFYNLVKPQIPDLMKTYLHGAAYNITDVWGDAQVTGYLDYKAIKQADIDAFKATTGYTTLSGTDEEKLEKIINQKIVALYPDEFQGWCENRRTGYPRVQIGPDNDQLKGVVPRRMSWPYREETINPVSLKAARTQYGGTDGELNKMWWDKNPDAPHPYLGAPVPTMTHPWLK